jgi:hypothetical protein
MLRHLRLLAALPSRIRVPVLCGLGLASIWLLLSLVTLILNYKYDASLSITDLSSLVLAFCGLLRKPGMPPHCPSVVDDGGMSRSFKARTYDTHIILNRNEFGTRNVNTLHMPHQPAAGVLDRKCAAAGAVKCNVRETIVAWGQQG